MRRRVTAASHLVVLLAIGVPNSCISPRQAVAGVSGSSHDLWAQPDHLLEVEEAVFGSNETGGQACQACHMPHKKERVSYGGTGTPLSQQNISAVTWQMYGSDPSMIDWIDGRIEPAPTGSSKLCLGCHDGITAVNQYDGRLTGAGSVGSRLSVGNTSASLTNNHPISITYEAGRDSQLRDPASAMLANGLSVEALLEDGRVECATCHDVHNDDAMEGTPLLRPVNSGTGTSSQCLLCHDK